MSNGKCQDDSQSVKVITLGNIFRIQRVQPVMDACGNNNRIPKMRAVLLLNCSASGPQLRRRQQNGVSHCLHVLKRFPSLLFRKAGGFQFSRRRNELATHLPKQRRRHGRLDQLLRNLLGRMPVSASRALVAAVCLASLATGGHKSGPGDRRPLR